MSSVALLVTDHEGTGRSARRQLVRGLLLALVGAAAAGGAAFAILSTVPPVYTATTVLLVDLEATGGARADPAAGQVPLVLSRDVAGRVEKVLGLAARPELSAEAKSWVDEAMGLIRRRNPQMSAEERVAVAYYDALSVQADGRLLTISFSAANAGFAAEGANAVAAQFIAMRREAAAARPSEVLASLEAEVAALRRQVNEAEAKMAEPRGSAITAVETENAADVAAELTEIEAARAELEAKAGRIRGFVATGAELEPGDLPAGSAAEKRAALEQKIDELSATLLPGHPEMRELAAEIDDISMASARETTAILAGLDVEVEANSVRASELRRKLNEINAEANRRKAEAAHRAELEATAEAARGRLEAALERYRAATETAWARVADAVRVVQPATAPAEPSSPRIWPMTVAAGTAGFMLAGAAGIVAGALRRRRAARRKPAGAVIPSVPQANPSGGHFRWKDEDNVRPIPGEPTLAPVRHHASDATLAAIAGEIIAGSRRRVVVTLAEGSEDGGRPLAAVALVRALARADCRAVLVDLRDDAADGLTMGVSRDAPGFTDLFNGEASFAQVIFRDRQSRAHLIPAGQGELTENAIESERFATLLDALDHTYDHVVVDAPAALVRALGATANAVLVASDHPASDPRSIRAVERASSATSAPVLLLTSDVTTSRAATAEDAPLAVRAA